MKLKSDLILRQMGTEYVIVDPSQDVVDMSRVFTLNETAAFIWRALEEKEFDKELIAEILLDQYDVDYDQALEDADILINEFTKEGLLEQ